MASRRVSYRARGLTSETAGSACAAESASARRSGSRGFGTIGLGRHWTFENDSGPDDANHDRDGIFILAAPGVPGERREDLTIYDVAPTILGLAGLEHDAGMRGRVLGSAALR